MAKTNHAQKSGASAKELKAIVTDLVEKGLKQAHKKISALEVAVDKLKVVKNAKKVVKKAKAAKPVEGKKTKKATKTGKSRGKKLELVKDNSSS